MWLFFGQWRCVQKWCMHFSIHAFKENEHALFFPFSPFLLAGSQRDGWSWKLCQTMRWKENPEDGERVREKVLRKTGPSSRPPGEVPRLSQQEKCMWNIARESPKSWPSWNPSKGREARLLAVTGKANSTLTCDSLFYFLQSYLYIPYKVNIDF